MNQEMDFNQDTARMFVFSERQMHYLFNFLNRDYPILYDYYSLYNGNANFVGEPIQVIKIKK